MANETPLKKDGIYSRAARDVVSQFRTYSFLPPRIGLVGNNGRVSGFKGVLEKELQGSDMDSVVVVGKEDYTIQVDPYLDRFKEKRD